MVLSSLAMLVLFVAVPLLYLGTRRRSVVLFATTLITDLPLKKTSRKKILVFTVVLLNSGLVV